jgi:hypothetical protein
MAKTSEKSAEMLINSESIESELNTFNIRELRVFFLKYPHAWVDLKRKLHKYRKYEDRKYRISKKDE